MDKWLRRAYLLGLVCCACVAARPIDLLELSVGLVGNEALAGNQELAGLSPSGSGRWLAFVGGEAGGVVDDFAGARTVKISARGSARTVAELQARSFSWAYRGEVCWLIDAGGDLVRWMAPSGDVRGTGAPADSAELEPRTVRKAESFPGVATAVYGVDEDRALVELESERPDGALSRRLCVADPRAPRDLACQSEAGESSYADAVVVSEETVALMDPWTHPGVTSIEFRNLGDLSLMSRTALPGGFTAESIAALPGRLSVVAIGLSADGAAVSFWKIESNSASEALELRMDSGCQLGRGSEWRFFLGRWSREHRAEFLVEATRLGRIVYSISSDGIVTCRRQ